MPARPQTSHSSGDAVVLGWLDEVALAMAQRGNEKQDSEKKQQGITWSASADPLGNVPVLEPSTTAQQSSLVEASSSSPTKRSKKPSESASAAPLSDAPVLEPPSTTAQESSQVDAPASSPKRRSKSSKSPSKSVADLELFETPVTYRSLSRISAAQRQLRDFHAKIRATTTGPGVLPVEIKVRFLPSRHVDFSTAIR
jgi:hypothetical protein